MSRLLLVVLLILFFVPLPLYLTFSYSNNKLSVFIYKTKVFPTQNTKKSLKKPKNKTLYPKLLYFKILQQIYNKSGHFLFKSSLNITFDINFGLGDSYNTAIFYGLLSSFINSGYHFFNKIFRIKNYQVLLTPEFNKSMLKFTVKSIMFINLAKIIYMSILIYYYFKNGSKNSLKPKEVV